MVTMKIKTIQPVKMNVLANLRIRKSSRGQLTAIHKVTTHKYILNAEYTWPVSEYNVGIAIIFFYVIACMRYV